VSIKQAKMRLFFGKKKDECRPSEVNVQDTIMKTKETISTLEKRQQHLELRIDADQQEARARAKVNDRRGALLALKRKQMLEKELANLANARITLEQQTLSLESARTQQVAVLALQGTVNAQKVVNQQININGVDQLMEQMEEQRELQNEISQVLSQGCSVLEEDDLLKELDAMEADEVGKKLLLAHGIPTEEPGKVGVSVDKIGGAVPAFSSVVAKDGPEISTAVSDEEQLRLLQAELA